ncbi:MAG: PilZ domain-containing protein [Deltaproteobacteria bacterium]|nr:PilZ domain-containing protein [Deltaproteobacteria bacterium]
MEKIALAKERRKNKRFFFNEPRLVPIYLGYMELPILDISQGGLSFLSESWISKDRLITLRVRVDKILDLKVLQCEKTEGGNNDDKFKYRVRGRLKKLLTSEELMEILDLLNTPDATNFSGEIST